MDTAALNALILPVVSAPYANLDEVIQSFAKLEEAFLAAQDRRAVFASAYLAVTRSLKGKLGTNLFLDDIWVISYALAFANLYRDALQNFANGHRELVPKAWCLSFDVSMNDEGYVILDLLLGINAHINHDLPLALSSASIDPDRNKRHQDHVKVNDVLAEAINPIEDRISQLYAPGFVFFDDILGPLDEKITNFSIDHARDFAWTNALALANASDDIERQTQSHLIDTQSAVLANLIITPSAAFPWFKELMRFLERKRSWLDLWQV